MRLANRVVLVTGASRGIGKAIAARFAREGAKVCLVDINEELVQAAGQELENEGLTVMALRCDVTDRSQVEKTVDSIVSMWGRLDILVNNAGIIRDNLLFKMTDEDWEQVMDVHLKGAFYCSRAAQKYMVEQKYGRIINLSSTSALGNRGQANYAAAKAGLQGFTKTLAIELGKFGITTNAIAPGFIETEMTKATAARVGVDFEQFRQMAIQSIPVGRSGKPEDIAYAALFFASEEASFVNGQVLYVAGGPKA
ncbi:short-chain dehydrogenase/reductase SDR [Caldalkalibacillus thermarum TA2.A1]|uniref:Short-chain dehydrogenase/reductase SDR n=1 Tax=Caldalkalibacillus thermarum (strain TA2.A1) TaxID=986075 RepID=F5L6T2_CALTT|nr:3-oxoacyl-ACP reductase FabG [Caldalkalibacillus thermarum]EGL82975.1 short-chain dehydrogenase/reductase SDR [Caldalkalibacillus thermarum TA2.A1]